MGDIWFLADRAKLMQPGWQGPPVFLFQVAKAAMYTKPPYRYWSHPTHLHTDPE